MSRKYRIKEKYENGESLFFIQYKGFLFFKTYDRYYYGKKSFQYFRGQSGFYSLEHAKDAIAKIECWENEVLAKEELPKGVRYHDV